MITDFGSALRNPYISSTSEYMPCNSGALLFNGKMKLPSTVRTGGGKRGQFLGPKLYTLTLLNEYRLSMYALTSSMLFVLYADSNPSDGHGITSTRDVIALMSKLVRAIDCWTFWMTFSDLSFRFFNKLPAPPLIDENENRPPAPAELAASRCCGTADCCGLRVTVAGELVGRGGGTFRFAIQKRMNSMHSISQNIQYKTIALRYLGSNLLALVLGEEDDLECDESCCFGLAEYFELYALDLHLESYLVAFRLVYPENMSPNCISKDVLLANWLPSVTFSLTGPLSGHPFVSEIAPSLSKIMDTSNRLFGSTCKHPLIISWKHWYLESPGNVKFALTIRNLAESSNGCFWKHK